MADADDDGGTVAAPAQTVADPVGLPDVTAWEAAHGLDGGMDPEGGTPSLPPPPADNGKSGGPD